MNESDSNSDTCVLGPNFAPMRLSGRVADVFDFRGDANKPDHIHIATGVTAYDHPDGHVILLKVHEGLWYGTAMSHSLINPNQVRKYGIGFWDNFHDEVHGLNINLTDEIKIPLTTRGTKVGFMSPVPTVEELQDENILCFEITSPTHWNPSSVRLSETTVKERYEITRTIQSIHMHDGVKPLMEFVDPRSNESELASIDPLLNGVNTQFEISEITYDLSLIHI